MSGEQVTLGLTEPIDIARRALKKVRAASVLTAEEMSALERAVRGELVPRTRKVSNWQRVVDCWCETFRKATGADTVRLTDPEMQKLKDVAVRCGGADRTCQVIRAFWQWRQSVDFLVQPSPFGLERNLHWVLEHLGKKQREQRRRDEHQAAKRGEQFQPPPAGFRRLREELAGRKTL